MELHKQGYDRIRAAYPTAAADEASACKKKPAAVAVAIELTNRTAAANAVNAIQRSTTRADRHCRPRHSLERERKQ